MTIQRKSLRQFLKEIQQSIENDTYIQVPKKLILDTELTPREKELWIILAGFMYKKDSPVFPSRRRLAAIMGIKHPTRISELTRSLQEKGCMQKFFEKRTRRIYYELYFQIDRVEEGLFSGNLYGEIGMVPSPNNRFDDGRNDNDD